jgi:hypothetical protein
MLHGRRFFPCKITVKLYSFNLADTFSNTGTKKTDDLSLPTPSKEHADVFTIHSDSSSPAPSPPHKLKTFTLPKSKHTMFLLSDTNEVCRGVLFSNRHPLTLTSHELTDRAPQDEFENREEEREEGVDEMWISEVFHMQISEGEEEEEKEEERCEMMEDEEITT